MAKNKEAGDDRRVGAVKARSQVKNPITGNYTKRDTGTGKFLDQKEDGKKFKGVRTEKAAAKKAVKKPVKMAAKKAAKKVIKKTAKKK